MFSGLTNQMNSWMGAVKGEGGEVVEGEQQQPIDPQQTQSEIATDVAAEQSFENVPVGEDEQGKATR